MSQENVEFVRQVYESFNHGAGLDLLLEVAGDDFVLDWSNSIGPAKGVFRGKEQVQKYWASFLEAFEEVRWEPEEIVDVDETRLIVVNHIRMRGRGSGAEVDATGATLWTFADGKPLSVKLYQTMAEALEAAGAGE